MPVFAHLLKDKMLRDSIKKHEGFGPSSYKDTKGHPTIYWGHKLLKGENLKGVNPESVLDIDLANAVKDAEYLFPGALAATDNQKRALVEMAFNMGRTNLSGFTKMREAIDAGEWKKVAVEALDSQWAKRDVGKDRSSKIAQMLSGEQDQIETAKEVQDLVEHKQLVPLKFPVLKFPGDVPPVNEEN